MSDYTPSVEALASAYVRIRRESDLEWGRYETTDQDRRAEFDRMIEAVRAEEREKAAQIAENLYFGGGATGSANRWGAKQAAARIRE